VTTNYDILIEQGLRDTYGRQRVSPHCYYAGLQWPQIVERLVDVARRKKALHILNDKGTAVCKLHGSINWAFDHGQFKLHEDVRAAFRGDANKRDSQPRMAAVVPPLPEKDVPEWLRGVWQAAEEHLKRTHIWIVCGSALPLYDEALRAMLLRASARPTRLHMLQLDSSEGARRNWREIVGPKADIHYARHLPEGLEDAGWREMNNAKSSGPLMERNPTLGRSDEGF
jgi:hypothetical protein